MYEMLIAFFVARPGRLSALGRTLFQLSTMILLVGLCGRIATTGVSAIQGMAGVMPRHPSLAALYPSLPTWWVPESSLGFVACALTAVLGLTLVQMGKAIDGAIG
ncbi:MAG: hypothetical protein LT103_15105 [Burkholderiaceae bacterium]|nr:hypothetical protein [Burkholderiaceae bacterium]ODS96627.1 MAG: hypothetical protein ABS56_11905 [Lautropia sp. SCN 69-89]